MIITSSLIKYSTYDIKQSVSTQIKELTAGEVYDYLPTPKFTLINPIGDEIFFNDEILNIFWYTFAWQSMPSSSLYYTYNDRDLHLIANAKNNSTASFSWDLSPYYYTNLPLTSSYKIIVSGSYMSSSIIDKSDRFTITTRSLEIIDNPIKGYIIGKNNIYPLQWKSIGLKKDVNNNSYVDIHFQQSILTSETSDVNKLIEVSEYIEKGILNTDLENYDWFVTQSYIVPGPATITISDHNNDKLSGTIILFGTTNLISSSTGYHISFPEINKIDAQGIYKYKEYAIELLDDIGEVYSPRSVIELTGDFGTVYIKPRVNFRFNEDGLIIGNVMNQVGIVVGV